jgi:hypothetical protein
VVLERGSFSLVSTIEELLGRNRSGSGLENRDYGRGDPLRWPRDTLYPQKLALTSPTSGGHSVGIVCCGLRPRSLFFVVFVFIQQKRKSSLVCCPTTQLKSFPFLKSTRTLFHSWCWNINRSTGFISQYLTFLCPP